MVQRTPQYILIFRHFSIRRIFPFGTSLRTVLYKFPGVLQEPAGYCTSEKIKGTGSSEINDKIAARIPDITITAERT